MPALLSDSLATVMNIATVFNRDTSCTVPTAVAEKFAESWRTVYLTMPNFLVPPDSAADQIQVNGRPLVDANLLFFNTTQLFSAVTVESRIVLALRLLRPNLCQIMLEGLVGYGGTRREVFSGNLDYRLIFGLYDDVEFFHDRVELRSDGQVVGNIRKKRLGSRDYFIYNSEVYLNCRVVTFPTPDSVRAKKPQYRYLPPREVQNRYERSLTLNEFHFDINLSLPPVPVSAMEEQDHESLQQPLPRNVLVDYAAPNNTADADPQFMFHTL
mgnify:CR=1 FL=1